ncbi:unnamed protein product [Vitrella brassicaformis CCMP3155]|uniref:Uncharacterized protein n=1 Tax=Vitrella brassicaformis (strain CCMP3155) TaxID=1169540 RepID=A0A0G4H7R6_VITBC|nr:unnamed protein product [Vitrella brassicaformis CCMP3155]|eukprot:CEM39959.1 unnamed protein product [Vitrella brassicaformis CCMP3155]
MAWRDFERHPPRLIGRYHVPWPPREDRILTDWLQQNAEEPKRAFFLLSMRWHPDKFEQSFGPVLDPDDRHAILQKVKRISQSINSEWCVLRRSLQGDLSVEDIINQVDEASTPADTPDSPAADTAPDHEVEEPHQVAIDSQHRYSPLLPRAP